MMSSHKIFIGSSVHQWNDPRILHKQSVSLAKHFSVELHIPAPFEKKKYKGVNIYGLPEWNTKSDRIRIIRILVFRILKSKASIVHLHDPELIPIGLLVKAFTKKKVIFDFHEQYEFNIIKREWIPEFLHIPLVKAYLMFERVACKVFDGVIGVIEDQLPVLSTNSNNRIIKNYPIIHYYNEIMKDHETEKRNVSMVYLGDITSERRIHEIIELTGILNRTYSITTHIIGRNKNQQYAEKLNSIINKYKINNKVKLHGYIPIEEAMQILHQCDIGLLPLRHPMHFVRSLPVKLFDYMSAGIPVVMPEYPLSKEVVLEHKCGVLVDPMDRTSMINGLELLIKDPKLRAEMGENGFKAVLNYYSWQSQEKKLIDFYKKVVKE